MNRVAEGYVESLTQEDRILAILRRAGGGWVDGMLFLRMVPAITQYHARIWGLQRKGFVIEGRYVDGRNWKEYRIVSEPVIPKI